MTSQQQPIPRSSIIQYRIISGPQAIAAIERADKLNFHRSSFFVASSWGCRACRACRRGCHEHATRQLLPWNSSYMVYRVYSW